MFGFGSAALDFRIATADLGADYREKLLARKQQVLGGGSVANCLVQIARLGGGAAWLGKLGSDWIGDRIIEDLTGEGVDCSQVLRDGACCSPFNVAVYAEGRRVGGFLLPNSLGATTEEEAVRFASALGPGDWGIAEVGEMPLEVTCAFCEAARVRGAKLVVDVDLDPVRQCVGSRGLIGAIFRTAAALAPNRSAMIGLYGDMAPRALASRLASEYRVPTIITAGAEGAYLSLPDGELFHEDAVPVELVDTVGAGDAFHGGLTFGLSRGLSMLESLRLAAWCGAQACTAFGARTGMPRTMPPNRDPLEHP